MGITSLSQTTSCEAELKKELSGAAPQADRGGSGQAPGGGIIGRHENKLLCTFLLKHISQPALATVLPIFVCCHENTSSAIRVRAFHASPCNCPTVIHFVELQHGKRDLLFLMLALLWASILLLLLLLSTTTPKSQQGCPGHVSPSISMCHPHPARCLAKVCEGKKHRTKVRTHVPSRLRLTSTRATWIPSLNQGANQPVRLAFRKDSETGFRPKFQPYQICCLKVAKGWF